MLYPLLRQACFRQSFGFGIAMVILEDIERNIRWNRKGAINGKRSAVDGFKVVRRGRAEGSAEQLGSGTDPAVTKNICPQQATTRRRASASLPCPAFPPLMTGGLTKLPPTSRIRLQHKPQEADAPYGPDQHAILPRASSPARLLRLCTHSAREDCHCHCHSAAFWSVWRLPPTTMLPSVVLLDLIIYTPTHD